MISFRVSTASINRVKALKQRLQAAATELEHRAEPHRRIKEWQIAKWAVNFDSEGTLYQAWPPLADATHQDRAARGYGPGPTLVRTGTLRAHFISMNEAGDVTDNASTWGFENGPEHYPVSHHLGINVPAGGQPARILWDLDEDDEERAKDILTTYVDAVIKRYF